MYLSLVDVGAGVSLSGERDLVLQQDDVGAADGGGGVTEADGREGEGRYERVSVV